MDTTFPWNSFAIVGNCVMRWQFRLRMDGSRAGEVRWIRVDCGTWNVDARNEEGWMQIARVLVDDGCADGATAGYEWSWL